MADCSADPSTFLKVGKTYASNELAVLTDKVCSDAVYRPDMTVLLTYHGNQYVVREKKMDQGIGAPLWKVVSIKRAENVAKARQAAKASSQ